MAKIQILDSETIDKIAAGEVVERPSSVVKELVENAMDAGSTSVTVEIKDGGISFIRVTDNGSGIEASQIRNAFLRHATSKISSAEELHDIKSLGFRGEALSSISAVARVELISKTKESLNGIRYMCEGATETEWSEVGAPEGTTVLVRNLFFNTPVRRKFLKQPQTEGSYIVELMEHLALSRPDIAFRLIVNGQMKFHTSGSGDLKEVIYRIYGREIAENLIPARAQMEGAAISGYLGKSVLNRSNRNFENYYINGRYIKSTLLAKAIEEGYSQYLMQHKFPFTVLHFDVDTEMVDVNVHPTKMDVRFTEGEKFFRFVADSVSDILEHREMIPEAALDNKAEDTFQDLEAAGRKDTQEESVPEPFETVRTRQYQVMEEMKYEAERPKMQDFLQKPTENPEKSQENSRENGENPAFSTVSQLSLFEEKLLSPQNRQEYRILGQIFDTYWLLVFQDKLFIVDQHAAHEKVKYERLIRQFREKSVVSQSLNPPIVVSLTAQEERVLSEYGSVFCGLGFEFEEFGGREYALRGVPADLYGCGEKELFLEVLDELSQAPPVGRQPAVVEEKLASMACKAAVKGNSSLKTEEMEALLDELLTLENPYNCPHGRPTIISMSKYEIEKKFKRIV